LTNRRFVQLREVVKPKLGEVLVSRAPVFNICKVVHILDKDGDISRGDQIKVMLLKVAEHATVAVGLRKSNQLNLFVFWDRQRV
jgi:hypothetical protein